MTPTRKKIKKIERQSKKLWHDLAMERAGNKCEFCGATENLQVHHIENKGRCRKLRYDLENACVLCAKHHTMGDISAHSKSYFGQTAFHEWLDGYLGAERLAYLYKMKYKVEKVNLGFVAVELTKLELEKSKEL